MDLEFLKFFSWTAIWAWVLSDTVSRYAIPYLNKFHDILDEVTRADLNEGKNKFILMKAISLLIRLVFSICLAYVMISWSVWCVLRCVLYTQGFETGRWPFFISGFFCCELALGKVANACPRRNFLDILPYVMGMGAFVIFSLNYEPIRTTFPWMIKFVGLNSL